MTRRSLHMRLAWWALCLAPFDCLARRSRRKSPRHQRRRELLAVRLDAIGDFILWLDAARELRQLYPAPQWRITLLGNRLWTPLARQLGVFDQVLDLDRRRFVKNPVYRMRILRRIHRAGFNVVLHPTYARDFLWGDSAVRAACATERIGSSGSRDLLTPFGQWLSNRWYTRLIATSPDWLGAVRRNAEFVRALGGCENVPRIPHLDPTVPIPDELRNRDYYVLCPGASHAIRRWPLENFARLAERIGELTGWTGVICGARSEGMMAERLMAASGAPLENYAGRTSIADMVSTIAGARLVISNETAAVHIAAAVDTPSVCILGGGHYGRFLPYDVEAAEHTCQPELIIEPMPCFNCGWNCIYPHEANGAAPCVAKISVESVWMRVRTLLPAKSGLELQI